MACFIELFSWCEKKIGLILNIICIILNVNIENQSDHNSEEKEDN